MCSFIKTIGDTFNLLKELLAGVNTGQSSIMLLPF